MVLHYGQSFVGKTFAKRNHLLSEIFATVSSDKVKGTI